MRSPCGQVQQVSSSAHREHVSKRWPGAESLRSSAKSCITTSLRILPVLTFVGGVRDAGNARGFVPVGPNAVVAVDLAAGAMLWRREQIGRPIAATSSRLITLVATGDSFVLKLFDTVTGEDRGQMQAAGMPDWADAGVDADVVQMDAADGSDGVHLDWRVRRPYRGGAPPSTETRAASQNEAAGHLLLNVDTGEAQAIAGGTARVREAPPPPVSHEGLGPGVVAADRVEDRVFALKAVTQGQIVAVVLEAHDAASGALRWKLTLAEQAPSRPTPLRK